MSFSANHFIKSYLYRISLYIHVVKEHQACLLAELVELWDLSAPSQKPKPLDFPAPHFKQLKTFHVLQQNV